MRDILRLYSRFIRLMELRAGLTPELEVKEELPPHLPEKLVNPRKTRPE